MKISIATWNMDNWKRTHAQRDAAWRYLTDNVAADIMLLQEFATDRLITTFFIER